MNTRKNTITNETKTQDVLGTLPDTLEEHTTDDLPGVDVHLFRTLVESISANVAQKLLDGKQKKQKKVILPVVKKIEPKMQGRAPIIEDTKFLRALNKAENLGELIESLPELKTWSEDEARQYLTNKKAYLRRNGTDVKDFARGRVAKSE